MTGIIITGHNQFASGIYSSMTMIAGQQEQVVAVNFNDHDSEDDLRNQLLAAIDSLNACESIVIMCDLLGGSPFKIAATLSVDNDKLKVLYGVNLGMLLEFALSRLFVEDLDACLNQLVETGKSGIGKYIYAPIVEEIIDEGI